MTQSRRHWGQRGGVSWQLSLSHAERFRDIMHATESCFETSAPEQPGFEGARASVLVCHGVLPCIFRWAATGPVLQAE
eukprot:s2863_g3.t1